MTLVAKYFFFFNTSPEKLRPEPAAIMAVNVAPFPGLPTGVVGASSPE